MQGALAACSPYEANAAKPSEAPSGPLLAVQGPYCRWGRIGFGTVDPSCLSPRHRVAHPPTVPLHVNPFIPNLPRRVLCPLQSTQTHVETLVCVCKQALPVCENTLLTRNVRAPEKVSPSKVDWRVADDEHGTVC